MTAAEIQELAPEVRLSVLILHYFEAQDRQGVRETEETNQIRKQIEQLIKGQE